MKTNLLITAAVLIAGSIISAQAETKDDVKAAIKKLSDKANYTWTATSKRPGDDDAAAAGGDRSRFRSGPTTGKTADGFVHVSSKRGDRTSESLLKGKKIASKSEDGWALVEERAAGDAGGGQRRGRGRGRSLRNFKAPAVQAGELLETVAELKKRRRHLLG
jgi:hypothetical protein